MQKSAKKKGRATKGQRRYPLQNLNSVLCVLQFSPTIQDAEFLPRAPDPEEIVIGGGESEPTNEDDIKAAVMSDNESSEETLKNASNETNGAEMKESEHRPKGLNVGICKKGRATKAQRRHPLQNLNSALCVPFT